MVSRAKVFGVAGFERQFAVKRFAPELTVGAVAQALSAAARSYGSLEHPRIARMSEFGVAQGQTFTAVEYVAGLDAFRLLQEAKLAGVAIAPGGALALVSQAARAVGYAHGRGLSHLGLAPTNVIVTGDGDVKVTDFGILAATMPSQPLEAQRLAYRIPYLAPEQLAGESTSAASDVFVLGVIAYELVTGQRAYRGETPAQVAHAILAGPPAEPPLPRPIVRVLQRCLARSPFERFPDARALADALDAALRVAPVPGTRKDIGAQVKATLERYAALNEGNLSGMVALNLQGGARLSEHDIATQPFLRPEAKTEQSPVVPAAGATLPQLAKPFATVPGLAPPPIPAPPSMAPPPSPAAKTILGLSAMKKPQIPSVIPSVIPPVPRPNAPAVPPTPPPRRPQQPVRPVQLPGRRADEPSGLLDIHDVTPLPPAMPPEPDDIATMPARDPATGTGDASRPARPTPAPSFETLTGEMSPLMQEELNKRSVKNTGEIVSLDHALDQALEQLPDVDARRIDAQAELPAADPRTTIPGVSAPPRPPTDEPTTTPALALPLQPRPVTEASEVTPPPVPPAARPDPASPAGRPAAPASRSRAPLVVLVVLLLGGLGAGGWYAYTRYLNHDTSAVASEAPHDAAAVATTHTADARTAALRADAGAAVAAAAKDAAVTVASAPADAAEDTATQDAAAVVAATNAGGPATEVKPSAPSDKLKITSKPKGARVFIDGADQGTTPVELDGSSDRHTMVLLLPGHDLYVAEVDGHGEFDIALKAVTPSGGFAGIKVIKCKAKERYYVYVDGKPTGMTCPTERIDTVIGAHTVEVYDIVTDSRRSWDIYVKDDRLSFRVRIDK